MPRFRPRPQRPTPPGPPTGRRFACLGFENKHRIVPGAIALEFVDDRDIAEELFRSRLPEADVVSDQEGLLPPLARIQRIVDQPHDGSDLELDLRGTPFRSPRVEFASRNRIR
jgi:hypothetical protein